MEQSPVNAAQSEAAMAAPLEFEIQDLRFEYDRVPALNGLSLRVREGERISLLGANGSGKSTLLRLMDGLYFAQAGTLRFRGEPLTEDALEDEAFALRFRRQVGLVFQNPDVQLFNPTVFDEVAFGPLQLGWSRQEILDRVMSTLQWIGAEHLKDRAPYRLSGGEKKRVAIASVVVLDPDVLLLDEPTAALDPRSQSQVIELLESWNDGRKTVITATHQLEALSEISGRAVVLRQGRVVADAAPEAVLADTELLEAANLVHVHRHEHGGVAHKHVSPYLRHEHHK
ncbi:MAG: ABC transporter ATP-binding protein [Acidobacteriota bacterium]|nr:ABC transporter ATP-binding protein [Acidobacteriota bacterium]